VAIGEAFLVSTGVVALAELGDKTQLLAFMLAARYKTPWPIVLGIVCATVLNHGLAGALGTAVVALLSPQVLRWALGLSFLAMAAWVLVPDQLDDSDALAQPGNTARRWGAFGTTALAFFLAEMGDKTQIATVALAAQYGAFLPVVAGTTLGMLLADVPAVFLGDRFAHRLPLRWIRGAAAALFAALGLATLLGLGAGLGF
jgi:Ca2+/H+ antiporter, TMEM165/GDT1 family